MRYIRKGHCNHCGFCCLGGDKNEPCKDLVWEGNIATCKIYGNHPESCKLFPESPPILTEKCGYYFIDTWNNNKILKSKEV